MRARVKDPLPPLTPYTLYIQYRFSQLASLNSQFASLVVPTHLSFIVIPSLRFPYLLSPWLYRIFYIPPCTFRGYNIWISRTNCYDVIPLRCLLSSINVFSLYQLRMTFQSLRNFFSSIPNSTRTIRSSLLTIVVRNDEIIKAFGEHSRPSFEYPSRTQTHLTSSSGVNCSWRHKITKLTWWKI